MDKWGPIHQQRWDDRSLNQKIGLLRYQVVAAGSVVDQVFFKMSILFCVLVIGCSDYSRIFLGLGVTSCLAFERECGQMWLNPKGVVWWGVIVVPTSWRPQQPWCPLEGDTCPSNQQPAAHQYNSPSWHRVFVNETWTLSCSIWWRHRTQSSLFVSMASNLMGRQRQNRCRTKQMDFGCKLFNQGRETKFWEAGELMRFSILGETGGNLHTSDYLLSRYQ